MPFSEGRGAVVAITPACLRALDALWPEHAAAEDRVSRLSTKQMADRIKAACRAAGLEGNAFSSHSGRVGLARMMSGAGGSSHRDHHAPGLVEVREMVRRDSPS